MDTFRHSCLTAPPLVGRHEHAKCTLMRRSPEGNLYTQCSTARLFVLIQLTTIEFRARLCRTPPNSHLALERDNLCTRPSPQTVIDVLPPGERKSHASRFHAMGLSDTFRQSGWPRKWPCSAVRAGFVLIVVVNFLKATNSTSHLKLWQC